jgi:hypothetical protein
LTQKSRPAVTVNDLSIKSFRENIVYHFNL